MNLAISSESATPGLGHADGAALSSGPGAVASETGEASGARFGTWMSQALQQHGPPPGLAQGLPGVAPDDMPGGHALALAEGSAESAESEMLDAAMAAHQLPHLPTWMPAGLPAMQQISVGPHLQVITARGDAPDSDSLSDFASQQGMGADTIAWLMGLQAQGSASLAKGSAAPSADASPAAAPGNAAAAMLGLSPGGLVAPVLAGQSPGGQTLRNSAVTSTGSAPPMAMPSGAAAPDAQASPSIAQGAWPALATLGAPALGGLWREAAGTAAPSPADPSEALPAAAGWMLAAQVRWSKTEGTSGPLRTAAEAPPGNASAWQTSELDLSEWVGPETSAPAVQALGTELGTELGSELGAANTEVLPSHQGESSTTQRGGLSGAGQTRAEGPGGGPATPMASDRMQQLSEKMADAIGERMRQELERGQWSLRLMLKPAHLGHIEVEMRLRAGELDATFVAPQAATRELLQEGLNRLKDSLSQAGMDVASLHVKNGQNRQNGGDSTPGQRQSPARAQAASSVADAPAPAVETLARPRRSDGWDVLV